jgi:acyl dehydratase
MLDRALIGSPLTVHETVVDRVRLQAFARAIGETNPVSFDVAMARAAGYPDLPVPPTFLSGLDMTTAPHMFEMAGLFGLDIRTILHAEQAFTYHAMAFAGDRLTFTGRVSDVYARRDGALEFAVSTSEVRRDGLLIVLLTSTIVVESGRSPGAPDPRP